MTVREDLELLIPLITAGAVDAETLTLAEALAVSAEEDTATRDGRMAAADAWDWLGRARELGPHAADAAGAEDAWNRAAWWWDQAGAPDQARRTREAIARSRLYRSGILDAELLRLVRLLRDPDIGGTRRTEALLELGLLQLRSGDPDEGRRALDQAAAVLAEVPTGPEEHLLAYRIERETAILTGDAERLATARAHRQAVDDLLPTTGSREIEKLSDELDDWDIEAHRDPADPRLVKRAGELLARWTAAPLVPAADVAAAIARRLADLHGAAGDLDAAAAVLRVAAPAVPARRRHDLGAALEVRLARVEARLGDWAAAEAAATRALELIEPLRSAVTGVRPREGYTGERIDAYLVAAEAALQRADLDRFLEVTELLKGGRVRPVVRAADADGAALADWVRSLRSAGHAPDLLGLESPEDRWLRRLAGDAWNAARPRPAVPPFSLAALRESLAPDEAVLTYFWLDPTRLVAVLIRPDQLWHEIRTVEPADRVRIEDVTAGASIIGGDPKALSRVGALGPLLLPPRAALDDVTRLYVSPHRLLHALPFTALELDGRPLLEAMSVVVAPSLTLLGGPRAAPVTGLLTGVDITEFDAYAGLRSLDLVTGPAQVAYANWEAAGRLGLTLSGKDASVAAVLGRAGDLAGADILQLVTHGTNPRPEEAIDARLALADGALDDLDLVTWPFGGALVIMFACYSGQRALRGEGGAELVADEINGLSAALFAAGAGSVLGSLWPAEEPFAAALIEPLHRHLLAGRPVDQALRAATAEVRATRNLFRRTYYWAPYVLSATALLPREDRP